jgi:hypothetical protein
MTKNSLLRRIKRCSSLLSMCVLLLAPVAISRAELPPSAYEEMQQEAPEMLTIKVQLVQTRREKQSWGTRTFVSAVARVASVQRTKSKLKAGQLIRINYTRQQYNTPMAGPSEVPMLKVGQQSPAYLRKDKAKFYSPAAGGYSFETMTP